MSVPRIQSLTRAIAILRAIENHPGGASTAELARATDLAPATAGRLLITLADAGFAERRDGGGWVVGNELVGLVQRADPTRGLTRRSQPLLDELAARGTESAMLAIPRPGPSVAVIAQADGPWLLGLTNWVGRPIDLHASAAGKLVLAELDDDELRAWATAHRPKRLTPRTITRLADLRAELARVRDQGWAGLDGESEPGLASVAVPVRDADGVLAAMLGFSGPTERLKRAPLLDLLLPATRRLS